MKIYESAEDYLEKILMLTERNGDVRSIDIATEMGVTKPSVSRAMGLLKQGGYVQSDADGCLTLTESGLETAAKIYERHTVLRDLLMRLGVDEKIAAQDACRIEHVISDASFQAIRRHVEK